MYLPSAVRRANTRGHHSPTRPSSSFARHTRHALVREAPQQAARGSGQVPGHSADTGSLARTMCLDHAVGPRELELGGADKSCPPCGLEMPGQKRRGQRRRAGQIHQSQTGTGRQFEAKCRVQIPIGRGRPSPHGVLNQLAIRLLVKQPAADVSARLRIEQPDRRPRSLPLVPGAARSGSCGSSSCGSIMRPGVVSGRFSWQAIRRGR